MIWQVISSEDKNYIKHRLLWLTEIAFFLLPISAIFLSLGFGSKLIGSTTGAAQAGAAIGTAIGGFFAVILGFIVGIAGGFICRSISKKYGKKITEDEDKKKDFFSKTKGWAFVLAILILVIASSTSSADKKADTNSNKDNVSKEVSNNNENTQIDQKKKETEDKLKLLEITSSKIEEDSIGMSNLVVSVKNNTEKIVDAITVKADLFNNFDEPANGFTDNKFSGMSQEKINPGATGSFQWSVYEYNGATKVKNIIIDRAHFTDGEDLSIE